MENAKKKMTPSQIRASYERNDCPCCGHKEEIHLNDICQNCMWQHDSIQLDDPDFWGGPNKMSLNQARQAYKEGRKVE